MRRRSITEVFLILAGLGALGYLMTSLFLPSSRHLIFGVNKNNGHVRLVQQNVTFLPPFQYYRLKFERRNGQAQTDGVIRILSAEKVPVKITYRLRFDIESKRLPDAKRMVRDGWGGWIRARVEEAVSFVTAQVPIEDFASPSSRFRNERANLRDVVARHLAQSGLKVTDFQISKIDIDREALLLYKRAELRRKARGSYGRVAVFNIEGADWELLQEMIIDDRMPVLETLIARGTTGSIQTLQPTAAPLLAATAATGLPPDRHDVLGFVDPQSQLPVDSTSRHAPAVWDIVTAFNRTAATVNWWTSWPPTSPLAFAFDSPAGLERRQIYPPDFAPLVNELTVPEATIGYQQVARFLNISGSEYQRALSEADPSDPVLIMRGVLAKTWTDHRVAVELYRKRQPMLFMMNYDGTDTVNHLFGPYHPPYREDVSNEGYRKYWPTVANYYAEIDRLLGEWMNTLPPDTTIIIQSLHGMRWGKTRPKAPPRGTSALSVHRGNGFFLAYGQNVAPSRARRPMSIYDMTPTLLALMGLPKAGDMPGNPAVWAFQNVPIVEGVRIASFADVVVNPRPSVVAHARNPGQYRRDLESIGHLIDPNRAAMPMLDEEPVQPAAALPPEKWGLYAYYNNLGTQLKREGKSKDAIEAFSRAIELNPTRATPFVNLAIVLFDRQQYTQAEEMFEEAVKRGLPGSEGYYVDFAALYRQRNMPSRAINLLSKAREVFPASHMIAANLGSALAAVDRYTEGVPELERALSIQPTSTIALNNLGLVYYEKKDFGRALDYWNRSLAINPQQPKIREGVLALQSRL